MLTHTMSWPRTAGYARVGVVSEQGGGQGGRPRPANPSGAELIGLGLVIALALALPALAGVGVDALLHSSPAGFLIGLAAGVTAAAITVVSQFRRYL